jgi:hypothetical protein
MRVSIDVMPDDVVKRVLTNVSNVSRTLFFFSLFSSMILAMFGSVSMHTSTRCPANPSSAIADAKSLIFWSKYAFRFVLHGKNIITVDSTGCSVCSV